MNIVRSQSVAGNWYGEAQAAPPCLQEGKALGHVSSPRSPKQLGVGESQWAQVTFPGRCMPASTCAPQPGCPRAKCWGLLKAERTGKTEGQLLRGGSGASTPKARGGQGRPATLKLALGKQGLGTRARRWRPLWRRLPTSFPGGRRWGEGASRGAWPL